MTLLVLLVLLLRSLLSSLFLFISLVAKWLLCPELSLPDCITSPFLFFSRRKA